MAIIVFNRKKALFRAVRKHLWNSGNEGTNLKVPEIGERVNLTKGTPKNKQFFRNSITV